MALRYGNAISLEQNDKPGTYISANPHKAPGSFPDFITIMKENPDWFTVLKPGGHATSENVQFGDFVKLYSNGQKRKGYLTIDPVIADVGEYDSVQIISIKTHDDEAQGSMWKILKADDFTSKAIVNFGDEVVFENTINHVKHHLSCGFNMTHPGLSIPRVTIREERGATEKWKVVKASLACGAEESRSEQHTFEFKYAAANSCVQEKICSRCGFKAKETQTPHLWSKWQSAKPNTCVPLKRACSRCKTEEKQVPSIPHEWEDVSNDCRSRVNKCKVCEQTNSISMENHNWVMRMRGNIERPHCTKCGAISLY